MKFKAIFSLHSQKTILMRLVMLFALSLYSVTLFSQTIPYATQQPKWVFPIYARDATGARDTIYFGYDPTAGNSLPDDPNFGEIWLPIDTNIFTLATFYDVGISDSCLKTNVFSESTTHFADLIGLNVVYPLTLYWDFSLLSSDSLPYPDPIFFPKAKFDINYETSGGFSLNVDNNLGGFCDNYGPVTITDSSYDCFCYVKDSLVLSDIFMDTTPKYLGCFLKINPWQNCFTDILDSFEKESITIYPNPTQSCININIDYSWDLKYQVTSCFGIKLMEGLLKEPKQLDVRNLESGFYVLSLLNSKNTILKNIYFIKTNL